MRVSIFVKWYGSVSICDMVRKCQHFDSVQTPNFSDKSTGVDVIKQFRFFFYPLSELFLQNISPSYLSNFTFLSRFFQRMRNEEQVTRHFFTVL